MKKQKICIVDDEPKILRFVSANLKSIGYEVTTAGSGGRVVCQFRSHIA
ncbi:hypothetical protein L5D93_13675 [Paenibacillus thiaminolyticus]|nr:hypothetical protein [Paenibacillus thiaminolyticus]